MTTTDAERFAALIEPHLGALHRAAYRLCRSAADAEDLVQDVCLRAYDRREQLEQADSPRAWLMRVQYNLHVDTARRDKRTAADSLDTGSRAEREAPLDDRPEDGPEAYAEAGHLADTLTMAWQSLNAEQQALLALHAEGYSLPELAEMTNVPLGALKARLHRARVRLGKLLKAQGRPRLVANCGETR